MALSTFDKKIIIKDPKAVDLILDGLIRQPDESKKPRYINIEEHIEKGKDLLKRIYRLK